MDRYHLFETAHGVAAIGWSANGVSGFRLPGGTIEETRRSILRCLPGATEATPAAPVAQIIDAAKRYFAGEQVDFTEVGLDLGAQEPLFARIYGAVRKLRWGETTTYGAVAKMLGEGPEAARDVGIAMSRNPIPLIIPCHRVLAAGGKIGGFSAPGGSNAKARMLALEGVLAGPDEPSGKGRQASFAF